MPFTMAFVTFKEEPFNESWSCPLAMPNMARGRPLECFWMTPPCSTCQITPRSAFGPSDSPWRLPWHLSLLTQNRSTKAGPATSQGQICLQEGFQSTFGYFHCVQHVKIPPGAPSVQVIPSNSQGIPLGFIQKPSELFLPSLSPLCVSAYVNGPILAASVLLSKLPNSLCMHLKMNSSAIYDDISLKFWQSINIDSFYLP